MKDKTGKQLSREEIVQKSLARSQNIMLEFEVMLLRWVGHIPSHVIRKSFYILAGIKIGKGSTIHMWANFFDPRGIEIGEDSIIGEGVLLDGRRKLKIGSHVDIASEVMIYNSQHDIQSGDFRPVSNDVV